MQYSAPHLLMVQDKKLFCIEVLQPVLQLVRVQAPPHEAFVPIFLGAITQSFFFLYAWTGPSG